MVYMNECIDIKTVFKKFLQIYELFAQDPTVSCAGMPQAVPRDILSNLWFKMTASCRGGTMVELPAFDSEVQGFESSGLYYKTITIIIMTIISDATIWSVTYDRN